MSEHRPEDKFGAGLTGQAESNLSSNFGAPTQGQTAPQQGGSALTARDILNLLLKLGGQAPPEEEEKEEDSPLIPPQTLALMQALIESIDPSINLSPEVLKGFLSTVTDLDNVTTENVFDAAARRDLSKFATERSEARIAGEKTERGIEADKAKADAASVKAEQDQVDRQAQAVQDKQDFDQQQQALDQRDIPKSTEAIIAKALAEGDFDMARRVNDFRNNPTDAEKLRLALDFATSPADVFTLSAIADGVFPGQFDKGGISGKLPVAPALQKAFDDVFNPQDPFAGREAPAPAPTQQQSFAPADPAPFAQPESGGVPLQPQPFSQPAQQVDTSADRREAREGFLGTPAPESLFNQRRFGEEDDGGVAGIADLFKRIRFEEGFQNIPLDQLPPLQGTTPTGGSAVAQPFGGNELNQFAREGPTQFPTPEPISRSTRPFGGDIQAEPLPPPPQQQQAGGPRTDRGFIPEGTSTFLHQFPGQEPRRLPQRFGPLFRGIKDPSEQLQRPESFLGARGLPRLDPGTFGRLSAGEQDAFIRLTQERGLDTRDVQREIESGRPSSSRISRISTAATRSR